jgi:tetratricopeptide (TPR) repeat protein
MRIHPIRAFSSAVVVAALSGCATAPAPEPAFVSTIAPETMVAAIRAAAGDADAELAVQPLRDSTVEDLRQQAAHLEGKRLYRAAANALDQALAINPEDPALLQERAEAAVLLREFDDAEALARRAYDRGAKVGPLCRRHWATVKAVREQRVEAASAKAALAKRAEDVASHSTQVATLVAGVAEAEGHIQSCKVAGPNRF